MVDFHKLDERALWTYIGHHGIQRIKRDASQQDLAEAVTRHFNDWQVDEESIVTNFCLSGRGGSSSNRELLGASSSSSVPRRRKRTEFSPYGQHGHAAGGGEGGGGGGGAKHQRLHSPRGGGGMAVDGRSLGRHTFLRPGEQVAAKVSPGDENGCWILARIVQFFSTLDRYEVADEDDASRRVIVSAQSVLELHDGHEGLQKGEDVLAMFPETTSFYRGKVSKPVKRGSSECTVQFEDDEEGGRTPHRKINVRYVMRGHRNPMCGHSSGSSPSSSPSRSLSFNSTMPSYGS